MTRREADELLRTLPPEFQQVFGMIDAEVEQMAGRRADEQAEAQRKRNVAIRWFFIVWIAIFVSSFVVNLVGRLADQPAMFVWLAVGLFLGWLLGRNGVWRR